MISNPPVGLPSKSNLSFFKKRLNPNSFPTSHSASSITHCSSLPQAISTSNSKPQLEERIKALENEISREEITMERIKELLELYAEAVEYYESINDDKYLIFKQSMLSLLNRPSVTEVFTRVAEKTRKEQTPPLQASNQPSSDFRRKNTIKVRTEELLTKHEEEVLIKKDLINNALKSQIQDINYRLENRRFFKGSLKKTPHIIKHKSLFLDIELINEGPEQSNLSTKSEEISTFEIVQERESGLCQTTRENRLEKTGFFEKEEKNFPMTCRSMGCIEKENEERKSGEFLKKIDEINIIYEQKIKVLEARFSRNGDSSEKKESKLFAKLIEKLTEEKNLKIKSLENE